ncbi:hypothetical protein V502_02759 [Pseudogymnoascus sp. VKM F-4520 (FW-2644)]|nr:hypothetical protein V502_02759 [Pseudogymnoascus sp. VKM F-4520 (FW-2644)]
MGKRVVFTGGSGKAGRHVIPELLKKGHQVLNLDLETLNQPDVYTLKTDLTQPGQVFNALCGQFKLSSPNPPGMPPPPDAVIHFAGMARNMLCSDDETFRINALSAYNVIDAACKLGVKKIILASTTSVYGVTFASGDIDYDSFPIDEEIDVNPMDTYAISKMCIERIARGFARRFGVDIYCLRIGNVIEPHEYNDNLFHSYVNEPQKWKNHSWSYTDARDLGQICNLGLEKSGLGFQVFNATNDSITSKNPTMKFLKEQCPNTPFTPEMGEFEAPLSNVKVKNMLGFKEEHHWENYFSLIDK